MLRAALREARDWVLPPDATRAERRRLFFGIALLALALPLVPADLVLHGDPGDLGPDPESALILVWTGLAYVGFPPALTLVYALHDPGALPKESAYLVATALSLGGYALIAGVRHRSPWLALLGAVSLLFRGRDRP